MKRFLMTCTSLSFVALCFALAFAACGGPVEDTGGVPSANGCVEQCNKCPAQQFCAQYCVLKGNCGGRVCSVLCIQGYHSNQHCQCVPDNGNQAGVACGTTTCTRGDVCCNDSCGICTPPGGFCTQQICAPPL